MGWDEYKKEQFSALGMTEETARDWNVQEIATGGHRLGSPPLAGEKKAPRDDDTRG